MSILGKIIGAVLKPKFGKEANKILNSEEYQSTLKEMAHSTDELNKLTNQMKPLVKDYRKSVKSMQEAGLKVKLGQTPDQMSEAFYQWQKERNEAF
ncbi:MAG: hypothetical protein ACOYLP_07815 [Flavobacterium sp.]|uniref:hypothetical protein n=1 Tax=Flavobacterium sp. TaxID=239 RepID=UPI003BE394B7